MGAFAGSNTANQQAITQSTISAIGQMVNGSIPVQSRTDKSPAALRADGTVLLTATGFDFNKNPAKAQPLKDGIQNAAENIVTHIVNGVITSEIISIFSDYNGNNALSYNNSPIGDVAKNINALLDGKSALDQANEQQIKVQPYPGNIGTINNPNFYPEALVKYSPKYKFLFVVEIMLYNEYQQDIPKNFTFLIKKFDKPKFHIEHEEINFYNFITHVPKRTKFSSASFEIHNDIGNETMNFIVSYLRRICPIFNQTNSSLYEHNGMDYTNATSSYGLHQKPISGDKLNNNIIEYIKVYDFYNGNSTMDVYHFSNPKLQDISFSDFDMDSSDGSTVSVEFVYDSINIETGLAAKVPQNALGIVDITENEPLPLTSTGAMFTQDLVNLGIILSGETQTEKDPINQTQTDTKQPMAGQNTDQPMSSDQISSLGKTQEDVQNLIDRNNILGNLPVNNGNSDKQKMLDALTPDGLSVDNINSTDKTEMQNNLEPPIKDTTVVVYN